MGDTTFAKSADLQSHMSQDFKTVHNIYPNLSFTKTYARAYRGANLTPAYTAWTTMTLDTESKDEGGNFAANIYTCPSAGRYLVQAGLSFRLNSATTDGTVEAAIFQGATEVARVGLITAFYTLGDQYHGFSGGDILSCAAGDTILLKYYVTGPGGTDITFQGGANRIWMSVQRIS
jgi:hypothetical protein